MMLGELEMSNEKIFYRWTLKEIEALFNFISKFDVRSNIVFFCALKIATEIAQVVARQTHILKVPGLRPLVSQNFFLFFSFHSIFELKSLVVLPIGPLNTIIL